MKKIRIISVLVALLLFASAPLSMCSAAEIKHGHLHQYPDVRYGRICGFVEGLYAYLLGRTAASSEIEHWAEQLFQCEITGRDAAYGFVAGVEFSFTHFSDTIYITKLYQALLGRTPAGTEINWWLSRISSLGRIGVLEAICESLEFTLGMRAIGIPCGF